MKRTDRGVNPTDKQLAVSIGTAARKARVRAGWTQADVAEWVGLATEVYGRLERGLMLPSVPTLQRLCLVLGLEADVACGLSSRPKRPKPTSPPQPRESSDFRLLMRKVRAMSAEDLDVFRGHILLMTRRGASRAARKPPTG